MTKKPITDWDKFRDQFVKWTLRRASFRWPPRGEAMKAARIGRGLYKCAGCAKVYGNKEVRVDHIEPVVPVEVQGEMVSSVQEMASPELRFPRIGSYVLRMFPEVSGLQVLCTLCHAVKTKGENDGRREHKRNAKRMEEERAARESQSVNSSNQRLGSDKDSGFQDSGRLPGKRKGRGKRDSGGEG